MIQRGDKLFYKGFDLTPSVEIKAVLVPGHPEYDGGIPGVSFRYLKRPGKPSWFYPCRTVDEFFADYRFANLTQHCSAAKQSPETK
jgi:hypothetical protein